MTNRILQEDELLIVKTQSFSWLGIFPGMEVVPDVVKDGKPGICIDYDNNKYLYFDREEWEFKYK